MVAIEFQSFSIKVRPSPETNDHEVCLLGDGEDLIERFWEGMIGLDPDDILLEPSPISPTPLDHSATIARCGCGVIGCGSVEVTVRSEGDRVLWIESDRTLTFRREQYTAELQRAQHDTEWETPERSVARLIRERVDRNILSKNGLAFEWASGRVEPGAFTISLCLNPGPYQVLVSVPWRNETPEVLATKALAVLERDPRSWKSVRYLPQRPGLRDTPF
jgi:hypothetical protein